MCVSNQILLHVIDNQDMPVADVNQVPRTDGPYGGDDLCVDGVDQYMHAAVLNWAEVETELRQQAGCRVPDERDDGLAGRQHMANKAGAINSDWPLRCPTACQG